MKTNSDSLGSRLRRKFAHRNKLVSLLTVSALLALALVFPRNARSTEPLQPPGYGFEGSWINAVSPILPPGAPPVPPRTTYITVAAGGAWVGSDRGRPYSSQHGSWVHLGGHVYAATGVQDIFDAAGTFQGTFKVRFRVQLIAKDSYAGVANVEQTDPAGNVTLQVCARIEGVRLAVESFEPPCQELEF